jgi:hypothetical protein
MQQGVKNMQRKNKVASARSLAAKKRWKKAKRAKAKAKASLPLELNVTGFLGEENQVQDIPEFLPERYETVEHPKHYNKHPSGVECISIIEWFPANVALVIKHLWRAGEKPGQSSLEDHEKALWYLDREVKRLKALTGG